MSKIKILTSPPIKKVVKFLAKAKRVVPPGDGTNAKIAVWLDGWNKRNFKSQGGKVGKWAPFKKGGRAKKGGGIDQSAKLLRDTGALQKSFMPFHSKKDAGIGSNIPYAKPHEFGQPDQNLPQRRMLPRHTDNDIVQALKQIHNLQAGRKVKRLAREFPRA